MRPITLNISEAAELRLYNIRDNVDSGIEFEMTDANGQPLPTDEYTVVFHFKTDKNNVNPDLEFTEANGDFIKSLGKILMLFKKEKINGKAKTYSIDGIITHKVYNISAPIAYGMAVIEKGITQII